MLHGSRPSIDSLEDESLRRQLRQDLADATALPSGDDSMHHLIVEANEDSIAPSVAVDPLQADFLEALDSCRHLSPELFRAWVNELRTTDAQWGERLDGLLDDLNVYAIGAHADRVGQQLFRAASSQGAGR